MKRRDLVSCFAAMLLIACGNKNPNITDQSISDSHKDHMYKEVATNFLKTTLPSDIYVDLLYHKTLRGQYIAIVYFLPKDILQSHGGGFEVHLETSTLKILQWGPSV